MPAAPPALAAALAVLSGCFCWWVLGQKSVRWPTFLQTGARRLHDWRCAHPVVSQLNKLFGLPLKNNNDCLPRLADWRPAAPDA